MKKTQFKQHFAINFRHLTLKNGVSRCWGIFWGPIYHACTQLWPNALKFTLDYCINTHKYEHVVLFKHNQFI